MESYLLGPNSSTSSFSSSLFPGRNCFILTNNKLYFPSYNIIFLPHPDSNIALKNDPNRPLKVLWVLTMDLKQ